MRNDPTRKFRSASAGVGHVVQLEVDFIVSGFCALAQNDPTISTERPDARTLNVHISGAQGTYPGMPHERGYELRLISAWPPETVTANGVNIAYSADASATGWHYDGDNLTTIIRLPRSSVASAVDVTVKITAQQAANAALLEGAAGRLARIRQLFHEANNGGPDSLVHMATTGRRIELKPETALPELRQLVAGQKAMAEDLSKDNPNSGRLLWTLSNHEAINKVEEEE
jgi:hypothetical protein